MEQPTIILENQSLSTIISYVINGVSEVDELLITNTTNKKYSEIAIKPCTIDISNNILEFLSVTQTKTELLETDLFDFICYTKSIDAETNQSRINSMSLMELIFIDKEILNSTGWNLFDFTSVG